MRRHGGRKRKDPRLVIDDSKLVHGGKGVAGLERGIAALLDGLPATLSGLSRLLCPGDCEDLAGEAWFTGGTPLPSCGETLPLGEEL